MIIMYDDSITINKYLIESENDDVLMLSIINVCIHKKQNKQIDSNDNKLSWKNMEQRMLRIKWKKRRRNYGCYGDDRFA